MTDGDEPSGEPVGSLGEEAARLLQALQGWATNTGGEPGEATTAAAAAASSTFQRISEHVATGEDGCRYCPVCQAIGAFRQTSPEVREHLAAAAASLVQAAAGVLATQVPPRSRTRREAPVERIELDDPDDPDDLDDPDDPEDD